MYVIVLLSVASLSALRKGESLIQELGGEGERRSSAFAYQDIEYTLPKIENSFALQLKDKLTKIQYKLAEDTFNWTVKI